MELFSEDEALRLMRRSTIHSTRRVLARNPRGDGCFRCREWPQRQDETTRCRPWQLGTVALSLGTEMVLRPAANIKDGIDLAQTEGEDIRKCGPDDDVGKGSCVAEEPEHQGCSAVFSHQCR